jgi:predicted kinase
VAGADFVGIWLDAPAEVLRGRVQAREGDVSDATPDVVEAQLAYEIGRQSFATVDAGRPLDKVVRSCLATIRAGARG